MTLASDRIVVIKALLDEGTDASLTYAALECRLTIEKLCYDRLKISYGHLSYNDLRNWQPQQVVKQVIEDANDIAASGFTLSISKEALRSADSPITQEEFEDQEYIQVGQQARLNLAKLGKLWNALSGVALHSRLPEHKSDEVPIYGSPAKIRRKVISTLGELEKLRSGSLLSSAWEKNYFFPCVGCETEIRRIHKLLRDGQVVKCANPSCKESYEIRREGEEVSHARRVVPLKCLKCENELAIVQLLVDELIQGQELEVGCDSCGNNNLIKLIPVLVKRKS